MNWDLLEPLFIIISIDIILGGDNADCHRSGQPEPASGTKE